MLRIPQAGSIRRGTVLRRGRARACPSRGGGRARGREELPLSPRRDLPPCGRQARCAGLLRPPGRPLPRPQEPPRLSRRLRLSQRDQPEVLKMKMMSPHARPRMPWFSSWLVLAASLLLVCFGSNVASADTAVLTRDGTLYEVFIAPYPDH